MGKVLYFAYGSNMSVRRMKERNINFYSIKPYILNGFKFIMNKRSMKNPQFGFANIVEDQSNCVEGVIYEIDKEDIKKLDKFEGYPKHYDRIIYNKNGLEFYVYIAKKEWVSDIELKTFEKYKQYILEGKKYVSDVYFKQLNEIKI